MTREGLHLYVTEVSQIADVSYRTVNFKLIIRITFNNFNSRITRSRVRLLSTNSIRSTKLRRASLIRMVILVVSLVCLDIWQCLQRHSPTRQAVEKCQEAPAQPEYHTRLVTKLQRLFHSRDRPHQSRDNSYIANLIANSPSTTKPITNRFIREKATPRSCNFYIGITARDKIAAKAVYHIQPPFIIFIIGGKKRPPFSFTADDCLAQLPSVKALLTEKVIF